MVKEYFWVLCLPNKRQGPQTHAKARALLGNICFHMGKHDAKDLKHMPKLELCPIHQKLEKAMMEVNSTPFCIRNMLLERWGKTQDTSERSKRITMS